MKKTSLILLILILFITAAYNTPVILMSHGNYKNKDISFRVITHFSTITKRLPNGRIKRYNKHRTIFKIISNKGFTIFNKTTFTFKGRAYIFNARNIKNYFYKTGKREFAVRLPNVSYVTLSYQVRKNPQSEYIYTRKVVKKFKIIIPANRRREHKIKIIAIR